MSRVDRSRASDLWAITAYFNPAGYSTRLLNYRRFRARLGVPLVAVELSFSGAFELGPEDADILIPLRGGDVMWQKERLLNIALRQVPPSASKIAWLDCDVIFENPDWAEQTERALERFLLVQPYRGFCDLPRSTRLDDLDRVGAPPTGFSLASSLTPGKPIRDLLPDPTNTPRQRRGLLSGFAWAAPRQVLERHGLYDAGIAGGGEWTMACAAYGDPPLAVEHWRMSRRWEDHYLAWARPWHETLRASVGFLEGCIFHLWHGEFVDRQWGVRQRHFEQFDFDPYLDIALDDCGCWRWNSDKPDLHEFLRGYFESRKEDGQGRML
jgi:hypothetical protein